MTGLFDNQPLEPISIVGEDIVLIQNADLGRPYAEIFDQLVQETPWRQEEITIFGKTMMQPRLIAWYGDPEADYSYSGTKLEPQAWTGALSHLRRTAETLATTRFNSVLLNYYRDHRDSMGLHSDDEPELGPNPIIASLSLGESRAFQLKSKQEPSLKSRSLLLEEGSVLVMRGNSQRDWKHGLRKQNRPCGPRINLTFRLTGL